MKRTFFAILVTALSTACASSPSPTAPSTSAPAIGVDAQPSITTLAGTWTGTTSGNSAPGTLHAVFEAQNGNAVKADVTWTRSRDSIAFTGALAGSISELNINVHSTQSCTFTGRGEVDATGTHYTGTYSGHGSTCGMDSGTFTLTKQQ